MIKQLAQKLSHLADIVFLQDSNSNKMFDVSNFDFHRETQKFCLKIKYWTKSYHISIGQKIVPFIEKYHRTYT